MPEIMDVGEPEASSDDSVSLTSTVESDEREYDVDCILAEWETDGVVSYLTKWDGYEIIDSTWQLRDTFGPKKENGHDVFKEWQERKMRISRGYEKAFDIDSFETEQEEKGREAEARRERRRRRKARLNRMVEALPSDSDESDDKAKKIDVKAQRLREIRSADQNPPRSLALSNPWSDSERLVFVQGLQASGGLNPQQIMAWYGHRGSINRILKDKTPSDMQKQLQGLRGEFQQVGRDPPAYMDVLKTSNITLQSDIKSRKRNRDKEDNTDGDASADSMTEQLPCDDVQRETLQDPKVKQTMMIDSSTREIEAARKVVSVPNPQRLSPSKPNAQPLRKTYSGTARLAETGTAETSTDNIQPRTGVRGKGPAHLFASKQKARVSKPTLKRNIGGIDVTANWSGEPKIRKPRTLPTSNVAADPNKPVKLFKTLGMRNSIKKWRMNEPAPDPASLVFVNPKTGKSLKALASPPTLNASEANQLSKSPFQQYQEELRAKEESNSYHNSAITGDDVQIGDHVNDAGPRAEPYNQSNQVQSPEGLITEFSMPRPHLSEDRRPPPNAPSGPRVSTDTPTTPFSGERHHGFTPEKAASLERSWQSTEALPLTLMGNPTSEEKHELFSKFESNLVIGAFKIGPALDDVGKMKLAGFERDLMKLLLSVKDYEDRHSQPNFEFQNICSVPEYQKNLHRNASPHLGSGYVVPYPENQAKYDSVAELLACHLSVGLCFARRFTMIIWPSRASIWSFLEQDSVSIPAGAVLRFAVREPILQPPVQELEPPTITRLRHENLQYYEKIRAKIKNTPIQPGEKHMNVVFREMFNINFDRLVALNNHLTAPKKFFLCFAPAECENYEPNEEKRQALRWRSSEEHDLFIEFLMANGAELILSMQNTGSYEVANQPGWMYFLQKIDSGVIIIHNSCGRIDQLQYLGKTVNNKPNINVWMTSLSPMDTETENHPHLVRYFPHGGVILVTVSLVLYRPHEALRLLRWFRLCQLPIKASGTWKIAVRPRYFSWLDELMSVCCKKTGQSPFGYRGQVYADIYSEIYLLLIRNEEPTGLMIEADSEIPEPDAPVMANRDLPRGQKEWKGDTFETAELDHKAIHWNDEELIHWFSQWVGTHLDEHRKFHVVLGYPMDDKTGAYVTKCYQRGYGYLDDGPDKPGRQEKGLFVRSDGVVMKRAWERNLLELMSYEKCFTKHRVKKADELASMDLGRREKEREARKRAEGNKEPDEADSAQDKDRQQAAEANGEMKV